MIQSGPCGEYPEMLFKKTLMNYNKQDARKSDEKSSTNLASHQGVRSAAV